MHGGKITGGLREKVAYTSQEKRSQDKLDLPTPGSWPSSLHNCEKNKCLLFKPLSLWHFVIAVLRNTAVFWALEFKHLTKIDKVLALTN